MRYWLAFGVLSAQLLSACGDSPVTDEPNPGLLLCDDDSDCAGDTCVDGVCQTTDAAGGDVLPPDNDVLPLPDVAGSDADADANDAADLPDLLGDADSVDGDVVEPDTNDADSGTADTEDADTAATDDVDALPDTEPEEDADAVAGDTEVGDAGTDDTEVADVAGDTEVADVSDATGGPDVADTSDTSPGDTSGTDATDTGATTDAGSGSATGSTCAEDSDCGSGLCVPTSSGSLCSAPCSAGCPAGWECRGVDVAVEGVSELCAPREPVLCDPCLRGGRCASAEAGCIELDDGAFCATPCEGGSTPCPVGFFCGVGATPGGDVFTGCVPFTLECGGCRDLDGDGYGVGDACAGSDCNDSDPDTFQGADEFCDGDDNNCNGVADEGFDLLNDETHCGACGVECTAPFAVGSCASAECVVDACLPDRWDLNGIWEDGCEYSCTLDPTFISVDGCDGRDNDCDGQTDEDVDLQSDRLNCGSCGNVCSASGAETACQAGTCAVTSCLGTAEDCNGLYGDGCETDTATSTTSCGACGVVCAFPNGSTVCEDGVCELSACTAGFEDCDGVEANGCETNTRNSLNACGACGVVCEAENGTATCSAGVCGVQACNFGFDDCDDAYANGCETSILSENGNCGSCGTSCDSAGADTECLNGLCRIVDCAAPLEDCNARIVDGCETDTSTSLTSCGTCGQTCAPPNAVPACSGGICRISSCQSQFRDCDGVLANGCEANILTSTTNCAGCGNACSFPNAVPLCVSGDCTLGACLPGFENCDGIAANGCEVNIRTSLNHCGSCNSVCELTNGIEACTNGACVLAGCHPPFSSCDGLDANGCETSVSTSVANCGGCGQACDLPGASERCVGGQCRVLACDSGAGNCDSNDGNGCETNTQTSVANCGACGNSCTFANGVAACVAGACRLTACVPGFEDCDGNPANGCEVNLNTNANQCGGCGIVCSFPNSNAACVSGVCTPTTCLSGFGSCDGISGNGCETNTNLSLQNCGGCGQNCNLANATEDCVAGSCLLGTCTGTFRNCDSITSNGCEADLQTSLAHCGGCGAVCRATNGVPVCESGACRIGACNAGFEDCNLVRSDGCEVNILTSVTSCGACGAACGTVANGSPRCAAGLCAINSCTGTFRDCDNTYSTGCETNIGSSTNNCGACGTVCSGANASSMTCVASTCAVATCAPGFVDRDGLVSNGCEATCSPTSTTDLPDDTFADSNCDAVDGTVTDSIFVSTTGSPLNSGLLPAAPVSTLERGIELARSTGRSTILVAVGNYTGARLTVSSGTLAIYGGYSTNFRTRSNLRPTYTATTDGTALRVSGVSTNFLLDRVNVTVGPRTSGQSAIAVVVDNSPARTVRFSNVEIAAPAGGDGIAGAAGITGAAGTAGASNFGINPVAGGTPGGGAGGQAFFAARGGDGVAGATYSGAGGAGGRGDGSNLGCGDGNPRPGGAGGAGLAGTTGLAGFSASAFTPSSGWLGADTYNAASGTSGFSGGFGGGGGGGGAGGGEACSFFDDYGYGGSGGGGAGAGGGGGQGGSPGGISIGLRLVAADISLFNVTVRSGNGGRGGNGGAGGTGGAGGAGGVGSSGNSDRGGSGPGGRGGAGGTGGCGGAGPGGPSYAVFGSGGATIQATSSTYTAGAAGGAALNGCGLPGAAGVAANTTGVTLVAGP